MFGEDHLHVIRCALTILYGGVAPLRGRVGGDPVAGSPFASELATAKRRESLGTARSIAAMLSESAGEHMMAFVSAIRAPMLPIACWTSIRSMLEPCARSAWLMEQGIGADSRIQRTFAIRFDGMEQDLKFARSMNQPVQDKIKAGIEDLERDALGLGYRKLRDKRNRRTGVGIEMPSATEIVREVLDEEGAYRIFSAVEHGQTGTIRQLSYAAVPSSGSAVNVGGAPATPFHKVVDPDRIAWLGSIAAKAFATSTWNEFTYAGWDRDPLRKVLEKTFDLLEAGTDMRFWR